MRNINKKFKKAVYFTYLGLLLLVLPAHAATIESVGVSSEKIIQVTGLCVGTNIAVHIFLANSTEPFYTAGGECHTGQYYFKDSLSYWKFADGDYGIKIYDVDNLLVNPSNEEYFKIETKPPEIPSDLVAQTVNQNEFADNSNFDEIDMVREDKENNSETAPGFLEGVISIIRDWFAGAIVFLKELVAEKITVSKICLGETCMVENQLKELFGKNQIIFVPDEIMVENLSAEEFIPSPTVDSAASSTTSSLLRVEDQEFIELKE